MGFPRQGYWSGLAFLSQVDLPDPGIEPGSPALQADALPSYPTVWILGGKKKARKLQKNIYFCLSDYTKAFDYVEHDKLWKILKEMEIPDHLTCFLRNLYAGQEAAVRTWHGTTDYFNIWKGVRQGCMLSPWLFNLYAEYVMRNVGLDEAQAGIKSARRNINNLRYAGDTTQKAKRNWGASLWKRRVKNLA